MAVRIRLSRVGATKRPSYRVVAIESRRPRDGRALEILGFYDPLTKPATVQIDVDRLAAWVGKGARPSDTVAKLIKLNGSGPSASAPVAETRPTAPKPKRSRKAVAKATTAAPVAEAVLAGEPAAEGPIAEEPIAEEAPIGESNPDAEPAAMAEAETPAEETE